MTVHQKQILACAVLFGLEWLVYAWLRLSQVHAAAESSVDRILAEKEEGQ